MHCYELIETARSGLTIRRADGVPYFEAPESCPLPVVLGRALTDAASRVPPDGEPLKFGRKMLRVEGLRLHHTQLQPVAGALILQPETRHSDEALVHLQTPAGVDGKVRLVSNVYKEKLRGRKVVREFDPFPPPGVVAYAGPEYLKEVSVKGVDALDLLLAMHNGASFRVERTGQLEGASPYLFVRWNGRTLQVGVPRRYEERDADGGAFAAG